LTDMRHFLRPIAPLLALALCACAIHSASPLGGAAPEPGLDGSGEPPVDELMETVSIYELYCAGQSYDAADVSQTAGFAFGWLHKNGLLSPYERVLEGDTSDYALPQPVVEEICALFFGVDIAPAGEEYSLSYSADYQLEDGIALSCDGWERRPDGGVLLSVGRSLNGHALHPATYAFVPAVLQQAPSSPLGTFYRRGDTVWQIRSVENHTQSHKPSPTAVKEIHTADDLLAMAEDINSENPAAQENRYLLCADLDLEGVDFPPIGTNRRLIDAWDERDPTLDGFNAVFDGQGHTIRNLTVTARVSAQPEQRLYAGMFAVIGEQGIVRNLRLENCTVTSPSRWVPSASSMSTGLLAGLCSGQIENCRAYGLVTGYYAAGGLVGTLAGGQDRPSSVTGCLVDASVTGHTEIGVLAGAIHRAKINNCAALGEVIAAASDDGAMPQAVGGFVGHSVEADVADCVSSCYVKTMVPSIWVGAFMAYNQGRIFDCLYDIGKAPGWEAVDVVYGGGGGATGVTAIPSEEAAAAIARLTAQSDGRVRP
jgi:hypothetical protein